MSTEHPHRFEIAARLIAGILFCWGAGNLVFLLASMVFGSSSVGMGDLRKPELIAAELRTNPAPNRVVAYIQGQATAEERLFLSRSSNAESPTNTLAVKQTLTNLLNRMLEQPAILALGTNLPRPSVASPDNRSSGASPTSPEDGIEARRHARLILEETFPDALRPTRHLFEVAPGTATFGYFLCSTLILHLGLFLVIGRFLKDCGSNWRNFLGIDTPLRGIFVRLALFSGAISVAAVLVLKALSSHLLTLLGRPPELQVPLQVLDQTSHPIQMAVFTLFTVFTAPFIEECLFRGLLFPSLQPKLGWVGAGWCSALLFAAVHADMSTFLPLVALSWVFIALLRKTGCLFTSILAHASFNGVNLLFFLLAKFFPPNPGS